MGEPGTSQTIDEFGLSRESSNRIDHESIGGLVCTEPSGQTRKHAAKVEPIEPSPKALLGISHVENQGLPAGLEDTIKLVEESAVIATVPQREALKYRPQ